MVPQLLQSSQIFILLPNNMKLHKGYTLLFAVLLTTVVLSISISILTIARKEVILSSNAKESFAAVYIADSALDCAVYNDKLRGAFSSGDDETIDCGYADSIPVKYSTFGSGDSRYTFFLTEENADNLSPCAKVTVERYASPQRTVIEARGYNIGYNTNSADCSTSHPKKVERAFRYSYTN